MSLVATNQIQLVQLTQNKKNKVFIEEETAPKKLIKTKIINFKEKEMIPLTDSENKFYQK